MGDKEKEVFYKSRDKVNGATVIDLVIDFVIKLSDSNFASDPLNYQGHVTIRSTSLCACICTGAH